MKMTLTSKILAGAAFFFLGIATADAQTLTGCLSRNGQLSRVQIGEEPVGGSCRPKQEVVHLSQSFPSLQINTVFDMDGIGREVGELGRLGFILSCAQVSPGLFNLKIDVENISAETIEWNNLPLSPGAKGPWLSYIRQQELVYPAQLDKARFVFTLDELNAGLAAFYVLDLVLVPLGSHGADPLGYCQFGGTVSLVQAEGFPE
jgi:hypothetical protein